MSADRACICWIYQVMVLVPTSSPRDATMDASSLVRSSSSARFGLSFRKYIFRKNQMKSSTYFVKSRPCQTDSLMRSKIASTSSFCRARMSFTYTSMSTAPTVRSTFSKVSFSPREEEIHSSKIESPSRIEPSAALAI